jgi:hypothetical protein
MYAWNTLNFITTIKMLHLYNKKDNKIQKEQTYSLVQKA